MIELIINWLSENYIEASAAFLGILSIYFGIKEKPVFWILTFANAVFFIFVYFDKKIYALMFLQFYFIFLSLYGFYYWIKGGKKNKDQEKVPIIRLRKKNGFIGSIVFIIVYFSILNLLKYFTDSEIPYVDALITTFCIFASFMMTKKYIENWFIWLVSDVVAIITFANQEMYPTLSLYLVFFISSIIGFVKWRKEYNIQLKLARK